MSYFESGDRVAWHHEEATKHGKGSILRAEALPEDAELGTVKGEANDEGTHFEVALDNGDTRVLTFEELVRIEQAEEQAVVEESAE